MKLKKLLALMMAVVLMTSLATACGNNAGDTSKTNGETATEAASSTEEGTSGTDENALEPITYTMFIGAPGEGALTPDNRIMKKIEEEFGIIFEIEYLVGDLDQKTGVMIASGEYPDIIVSNNTDQFIDAGAYVDIKPFLSEENTPNIMSHYADFWPKIEEPSGAVHVLPNYGRIYNELVQTSYGGPAFWIQKAVLKEFDYPEIKSLDEYFDIIEQYKEKYPTIDGTPTIGFEVLSYDWRSFCLKNPPAQLAGYPNDGGVMVDPETHEATFYANTNDAYKYYSKLNEAYNRGLIQADTFILNYDEYLARLSTGAVLGMSDQGWQFEQARLSLVEQGKDERTWVPLAITYEGVEPYYRDQPSINVDRGFGVSVDCEDPERFVKLLDALITEEWQKLFTWGVEGVDYSVDENGLFYRSQEQRDNFDSLEWRLANMGGEFFEQMPKMEGKFSDGNTYRPADQPSEYRLTLKDIDIEVLDAYGVDTYAEMLGDAPMNRPDYPAWQIGLGDNTDAAIAEQEATELQNKYLPQMIILSEGEFDAAWAEYLERYESVNIEAYVQRMNEGMAAIMEAYK